MVATSITRTGLLMVNASWSVFVQRVLCVQALVLCASVPANAQKFTITLQLHGQQLEGSPLAWTDSDVALLRRDGSLLNFSPAGAEDFRKTSDGFQSYSQSELRTQLAQEFGPRFDVSGTGHYLVVHPIGQRDRWAGRFEQLYRAFVQYFAARGSRPREPQFPLVAVVLPDESAFLGYTRQTGARVQPHTLGYYSPNSNRIVLYDNSPGGPSGDSQWPTNAATIIHEAAHQSAFNTSIHNRFAPPPRWVIEGLGTMFEARGVWDSRRYPAQADRINQGRLADFQRYAATRRKQGSLAQTVGSDRLFHAVPADAYAEAWALTFFLAETRPAEYVGFLRKTAARASFTDYPSPARLRDFTASFGADLRMLETQFIRYIAALKLPPARR